MIDTFIFLTTARACGLNLHTYLRAKAGEVENLFRNILQIKRINSSTKVCWIFSAWEETTDVQCEQYTTLGM